MTDQMISKDELLAKIAQGWNSFQSYMTTLTDEQVTIPTDAAGWTVKDHLAHLDVWEDSVWALLEKKPRAAYMGLTSEMWTGDYNQTNEVLRQRDKNITLVDLQKRFLDIHQRLSEKIASMSDEDLQRPYRDYQSDSSANAPVIDWIAGNTFEHYVEHLPWIKAIVASGTPKS